MHHGSLKFPHPLDVVEEQVIVLMAKDEGNLGGGEGHASLLVQVGEAAIGLTILGLLRILHPAKVEAVVQREVSPEVTVGDVEGT